MKMIPCMKCKHYTVTFDKNAPRGCKLFNFKGVTMPYILVFNATGSECTHFSKRQNSAENEEDKKTDYNDPKYWK